MWGQPNGQFSLTKDWRRFDSDVDYRRLFNPAHNTKDNSDGVVGEVAQENSYTVEQGIFVVQMVKEFADLKIINLSANKPIR